MKNKYLYIILVIYTALILRLIVFKYPPGATFSIANANLIPFKTILGYLSGEPTWGTARLNLLGNIIVFIPFGFLFAALYSKLRWSKVLLAVLVSGAASELLQAIFRSGILDIDDIILNSSGVIIGYLLFILLKNVFKKSF
jgi:glycopeptide antibiotics resistance protein